MKWKDGGMYGQVRREIVSVDKGQPVATVRVRQYLLTHNDTELWPEGVENFRLILQAPRLLEALGAIADKARRMLLSPYAPGGTHCPHEDWADWELVRGTALAAIAAVKGEEGNGLGS